MALDNIEGLAFRYQYLSIPLSETEQAAFFGRFGRDLESLIRGRFDRIERKLDEIEFARWKAGPIKSLDLHVDFKKPTSSRQNTAEHFRVCLELQSVCQEKRSIALGGRDDYLIQDGASCFAAKTFFWRQQFGAISES